MREEVRMERLKRIASVAGGLLLMAIGLGMLVEFLLAVPTIQTASREGGFRVWVLPMCWYFFSSVIAASGLRMIKKPPE